jgi:hypothetical protein
MEREWKYVKFAVKNLFWRISESKKIEDRGRKTEEEDGDHCSSPLCCFIFLGLVDEISLSLSLLGRCCVLFLQLVIMQQVTFLLSHL